jgi:hypothetical protein
MKSALIWLPYSEYQDTLMADLRKADDLEAALEKGADAMEYNAKVLRCLKCLMAAGHVDVADIDLESMVISVDDSSLDYLTSEGIIDEEDLFDDDFDEDDAMEDKGASALQGKVMLFSGAGRHKAAVAHDDTGTRDSGPDEQPEERSNCGGQAAAEGP